VVASTSWTAAFASAAGAEEVVVLAPFELQHPPEYELKPTDVAKVREAQLVVFAGYERFAQKLAETAGGGRVPTLKVNTVNTPDNIKMETRRLAEALGTQAKQEEWEEQFDSFTTEVRSAIQRRLGGRRVVVNRMIRPFVEWAGFDVIGEFGPAEPSPQVIADMVAKKPDLVIDVYHTQVGKPAAEGAKAPYVALINFPGKDGTRTLEDVFRHNQEALLAAAPAETQTGAFLPWAAGAVAVLLAVAGFILWRRL
jgi:zinc transport system substrate-binding protein/iron/zinc/copper transport system substrate-binding protein